MGRISSDGNLPGTGGPIAAAARTDLSDYFPNEFDAAVERATFHGVVAGFGLGGAEADGREAISRDL